MHAEVYEAAARHLREGGVLPDDAERLLHALDYLPRAGADDQHRARLLAAAGRMQRLFRLPMRHAPGLVFMGGEASPASLHPMYAGAPAGSLAGSGLTLREAFESCVGEGIEYLSQFALPGDIVAGPDTRIDAFPDAKPAWPAVVGGWVRGTPLAGTTSVLLPAARCLRQWPAPAETPFALSTGCAAGATREAAALHGLLELIERDAASQWWRGGRRGRPVLPDPETDALVDTLRGSMQERSHWLLDISTDLGVPCVAAMSFGTDGRGFACGMAAGMTVRAAARSALKEMCHVELAYDVIAAKRAERGEAGLNVADRRHLRRAGEIGADCPLLHPQGEAAPAVLPEACSAAEALAVLAERLRAIALDAYLVDLSRSLLGVAAVRVVAPGLQLEPCAMTGPRLRDCISRTGGGAIYVQDIPLL